MKPFNLERALKGDPVVTRKGLRVMHIAVYCDYVSDERKIRFIVEGYDCAFYCDINGKDSDSIESSLDLFMATVKKKLYIRVDNVERSDIFGNVMHETSYAYLDKKGVKENIYSQIIEIEIDV